MQSINPIIEQGNDWQYRAILKESEDQFKAFIRSPRGPSFIGTFNTEQEANEAIDEAQQAHWNG